MGGIEEVRLMTKDRVFCTLAEERNFDDLGDSFNKLLGGRKKKVKGISIAGGEGMWAACMVYEYIV